MDELELLKKDWKTREQKNPQLSYDDIYSMLFKKSTSIVKWIFIISIGELLFWSGLSLLTPKSSYEILDKFGVTQILWGINIIHYIVFIGFIFLFYKNYSGIKVTDSTKQLINNIINTRKTVRYFVIYNVVVFVLTLIFINILYYLKSDVLIDYIKEQNGSIYNPSTFLNYFFIIQIVIGVLMLGLLLLFYRVVYGILLQRLKNNHKELEKIEI
ncbi:MAG: hypothetical protein CVU03_03690 [Bacteroidetes bacterium HGW-Bacteroidetes-2]|jgi:uncharacterized membrane protein YciS (DUF1049 family)|nr:MAG: hypothetical protein CVU03_03690 [Bacteroidetes bacterium HGW-Bacteroidetes-2]